MTQPIHPMLERVTRAMFEAQNPEANWDGDDVHEPKWTSVDSSLAGNYRKSARAAIQALLEPDEGMLRAVVSWPALWEWPGTPVQQAAYAADKLYARSMFTDILRPLIGEGE